MNPQTPAQPADTQSNTWQSIRRFGNEDMLEDEGAGHSGWLDGSLLPRGLEMDANPGLVGPASNQNAGVGVEAKRPLDGEQQSETGKVKRIVTSKRKEQNRIAQKGFRERKEREAKDVEESLQSRTAEVEKLSKTLAKLEAENAFLRSHATDATLTQIPRPPSPPAPRTHASAFAQGPSQSYLEMNSKAIAARQTSTIGAQPCLAPQPMREQHSDRRNPRPIGGAASVLSEASSGDPLASSRLASAPSYPYVQGSSQPPQVGESMSFNSLALGTSATWQAARAHGQPFQDSMDSREGGV